MKTYTVQQLAELLNSTEHGFLRLIHSGELVGVDISISSRPRWRVLENDLQNFLLRRSSGVRRRATKQARKEAVEVEYF